MLILCLDSSDRSLRTGLFEDGNALCEIASDSMGNHSEHIINQIDNTLAQSSKGLDEIDLLTINVGPGSFTGLRIGMSAMAGISLSLGIPLVGFNSFEIIIEDLKSAEGYFLALIQCRGDEFYSAEFEALNNTIRLKSELKIISPGTMNDAKNELYLAGPGAELFLNKISENIKHKFRISPEHDDLPTLNSLAKLASINPPSDHRIPELFYLAPSQAEVNYDRKNGVN